MASLAVVPNRSAGSVGLFEVDGDELDVRLRDEQIEIPNSVGTETGFDNHGHFDERSSGHCAPLRGFDGLVERTPLGFVLEDGHECRRVNDHQVGTPVSS